MGVCLIEVSLYLTCGEIKAGSLATLSIIYFFVTRSLFVGTTWVQEIVWQIYNEGAISSEKQMFRFPFFEASACNANKQFLVDFKTLPSPRLIKTHLTHNTTPRSANKDAQCKYFTSLGIQRMWQCHIFISRSTLKRLE